MGGWANAGLCHCYATAMPQTSPPAGPPSRSSLLPPSIEQPRAARAPPEASASSRRPSNSLAQRELPQKQPLLSLCRAAPRSGSSPKSSPPPPSSSPAQRELPQKHQPLLAVQHRIASRSGSSPRSSLSSPSVEQPRAAGAPPKAASPPPSSSPAQRELPQKQPLLSLYRAAPRSGSSPRSSLLLPSIEQPRAAGAPPEASASSRRPSNSLAQRELPQKQPLLSLYRAAPRSGSSPRSSLLPPFIEQPRAAGLGTAGAPPGASASSRRPSNSLAQREPPQKQPLLSLYRAAPRSGSSPRSSLLPPFIEQPRAAGAPPEASASSRRPSNSLAQRELPQKQPLLSLYRAAPRSGSSPRSSLLPPSIEKPRAAGAPPKAAPPPPSPLHRAARAAGAPPEAASSLPL